MKSRLWTVHKNIWAVYKNVLTTHKNVLSVHNNIPRLYQIRNCSSKGERCDAHMNELPIPCGPWDEWYKGRQSYYNKVLVFGALWWLFSFGMMIYTDSFYLNWSPPAQPGPPSDMVEECEDVE